MEWLLYFGLFAFFLNIIDSQKYPYDGGENEFTITISPGQIECFYQRAKIGNTLEIEYQVSIL